MNLPTEIQESLSKASLAFGISLRAVRFWEDEFRPGWYCRFHGVVHESPVLRVEVAGSLAIDLLGEREDEIDLFVFVNGSRVGPIDAPYHYLHQDGASAMRWDDLDEGFSVQKTLAKITNPGA